MDKLWQKINQEYRQRLQIKEIGDRLFTLGIIVGWVIATIIYIIFFERV